MKMWAYVFLLKGEEKVVFAESVRDARIKFKKLFYTDAGSLIRRERW